MRRSPRTAQAAPAGEVSRRIRAPVAEVYAAIADLPRMGRFSPECVGGYWLDGADHAAAGVRFRGYNRFRWMRWSRVVEVTEGPATTRVIESFRVQRPPSWFIRALDVLAGRTWADPTPGMRTTLERLDQALAGGDERSRPATA